MRKDDGMNYYYINTDTDALGYSPHEAWIEHGHAFTSDEAGDDRYGKLLERLEPDDILFMYVTGSGVVTVGRVSEHWNGTAYEGNDRWIHKEYTESRIRVDWFLTFVDNPIRPDQLRSIVGWTPVQTLQRIAPKTAKDLLDTAHYHDYKRREQSQR